MPEWEITSSLIEVPTRLLESNHRGLLTETASPTSDYLRDPDQIPGAPVQASQENYLQ